MELLDLSHLQLVKRWELERLVGALARLLHSLRQIVLFSFDNGEQWRVGHYRLERPA